MVNEAASLLELYSDSMQTVYARGSGGGGSQQREVADGADVVFTDTVLPMNLQLSQFHTSLYIA